MRFAFGVPGFFLLLIGTSSLYAQWRHFEDNVTSSPSQSWSHEMVAAHNAIRARVGVGPLSWSDRLATVAQKWAETLLARNQFAHSRNKLYGENLFEISGGASSPHEVVENWASESLSYDYKINACADVCGHYTQIVWASTRSVGCAVARKPGHEIWVCEYEPPGNYVGERPY
jgi:pathogenesis-related protein 1